MLSLITKPAFHITIGSQIGNDSIAINRLINQLTMNKTILISLIINFLIVVYGILNPIRLHF